MMYACVYCRTFLTLSLPEVSSKVGLENACQVEKMLLDMVDEGSVRAKTSQKDGMVTFDSGLAFNKYDSEKALKNLEADLDNCMALDKHVKILEENIALNPTYIKRSASSGGGASGVGGAMDLGGEGKMTAVSGGSAAGGANGAASGTAAAAASSSSGVISSSSSAANSS